MRIITPKFKSVAAMKVSAENNANWHKVVLFLRSYHIHVHVYIIILLSTYVFAKLQCRLDRDVNSVKRSGVKVSRERGRLR